MTKHDELPSQPSDAQLEVLNILWDRGEATVGEVWQAFYTRRPVARNTVLTLMTRLEEKGWVRRRSDSNVLRYSAAVPQQTGLRQIARRLVDTAFRGSAEGLVMTLLDGGDLSEGESERIRAMLENAHLAKNVKKGRAKP
jgi:BlaI family transcriptional regulator, penicillinase repressor